MVGSDHLPMIIEFSVNSKTYGKSSPNKEVITEQQYFSWNSLSETELKNISEHALSIQSNFFNNHRHRCNKIGCSNTECLSFIENIYDIIIKSVHMASDIFYKKINKKKKIKIIPG